MQIKSLAQLRDIYPEPTGRAAIKVFKELEKYSRQFISLSPFCVVSTVDKEGNVDASPRGGQAGFVHILDATHLIIPDSKGNRRQDSHINILATGAIGVLFFIPGVNETMRINGKATIHDDEDVLTLFAREKNPPKVFIKIAIDEIYMHCAKALVRSALWNNENQVPRSVLPTMGEIINAQTGRDDPVERQAEMEARHLNEL